MLFDLALNTSTLRGHGLGLEKMVAVAAAAGYQGIEPWIADLDRHEAAGGTAEDLGARIRDAGLAVPSAIAFSEWLVDDDGRRRRALDEARRDMDRVARLGGRAIAAAPAGVEEPIDLRVAAERYRALLEIGDERGVTPLLEFWGKSPALRRLGQAAAVAIDAGHPRAQLLADVYHLHKGGSGVEGLGLLRGSSLGLFHLNDYPGEPPRERIEDRDRVFPGDGVAPLARIFELLREIGYRGMLSLELFNEEYYRRDPSEVALEGRRKSIAAMEEGSGHGR